MAVVPLVSNRERPAIQCHTIGSEILIKKSARSEKFTTNASSLGFDCLHQVERRVVHDPRLSRIEPELSTRMPIDTGTSWC